MSLQYSTSGAPEATSWRRSLGYTILLVLACSLTISTATALAAGQLKARQRVLLAEGNGLCASDQHCADAVPIYAELVRLAPDVPGFLDNYANALRAAGRWDEALAASDRAIALRPDLAFLHYGRARDLEGAGRVEAALEADDRAIALAALPTPASLWEYKGRLLGVLRRYADAHAAFDRALMLDPARTSVLVSRADVEIAEGRRDAALADLQRYPSGGRRADEVRQKLERARNATTTRVSESTAHPLSESLVTAPAYDDQHLAVRGFRVGMSRAEAEQQAQRACSSIELSTIVIRCSLELKTTMILIFTDHTHRLLKLTYEFPTSMTCEETIAFVARKLSLPPYNSPVSCRISGGADWKTSDANVQVYGGQDAEKGVEITGLDILAQEATVAEAARRLQPAPKF